MAALRDAVFPLSAKKPEGWAFFAPSSARVKDAKWSICWDFRCHLSGIDIDMQYAFTTDK